MSSIRSVWAALAIAAVGCGGDAGGAGSSTSGAPTDTASTSAAFEGGHHPIGHRARVATRTDLVSDVAGVATVLEPDLVNAWGLAFSPTGFAWLSANGDGLSLVLDANGKHVIDPVKIPPPERGGATSAPTGQVFNGDPDFFGGDRFIFVTEDGTVSGWQSKDGASAVLHRDLSATLAVYKGTTLATDPKGNTRLYAADFHNGKIDVWDSDYDPFDTNGGFRDDQLPSGYAPFDVQAIEGVVLVTYALQDADAKDDVKGAGNGYVDAFTPGGALLSRLVTRGALNSPWGVARVPDALSPHARRLLIGNFGDGMINVYRIDGDWSAPDVSHEGALLDRSRAPLVIDGLWALQFGPGAGGFGATQLYFTAGPSDEQHGLFGVLDLERVRQRFDER